MGSTQKVILLGRLGKDVDVKNLDSGKRVANLSVATTESWKDEAGEKKENTTWHQCEWWNAPEKLFDFLKKGSEVYLEGKIRQGSYQKGDVTIPTFKIVVDQLILVGGKPGSATESNTDSN